MAPTYRHLQLVIIDKRPTTYSNGDVIVFRKEGIDGLLIKRIVACPGEQIRITDSKLFVNEVCMESATVINNAENAEQSYVLGPEQYFVLGDNANHSIDSRSFIIGAVSLSQILGRVIFP